MKNHDAMVIMEPRWNPAVEDQASERLHRIEQTRPVTIYRLIAENTIEEKIIKMHHEKRDLATNFCPKPIKQLKCHRKNCLT